MARVRRPTSPLRSARRSGAARARETRTKPDFPTHFLRGIEHFNAAEFWEAHEAWEELWLAAESDLEQYLQGLIQLAAAYHHFKRGTLRGGVRLVDAALRRLSAFPNPHCDLDRDEAVRAAQAHRQWASSVIDDGAEAKLDPAVFPKLHRHDKSQALRPPRDKW